MLCIDYGQNSFGETTKSCCSQIHDSKLYEYKKKQYLLI